MGADPVKKEIYFCTMEFAIETYSTRKVFFTSDTHFFHENVMRYSNRPFESVEEMNEAIISNWNKVVPRDGIVFHLGDFSFGGERQWNEMLDRLKGEIHLIVGNHDIQMLKNPVTERFAEVEFQKIIQVGSEKILLNHYPFLCFSGEARGQWQLFGHVHGGEKELDRERLNHLFSTQYDVGVDANAFTPVSFDQIKAVFESRQKG